MALIKELINLLDSEDEPLPKRLKMAGCAFKSTALPIHFKEIQLLKWLMGLAKNGNGDVLPIMNEWLDSDKIANISKTDVSQEDVFEILGDFITVLSLKNNRSIEPIIIGSFLSVINNKAFQQYFKHDIKLYFKFICQVIECVKDVSQLLIMIKCDGLFNKHYFTDTKSFTYFCEICLPTLGRLMISLEDNLKKEIIRIVSKCIFQKNINEFEHYLKTIFQQCKSTENFAIPIAVLHALCDHYNNRNLPAISCLYTSFCSVFELKFTEIYRFTVLLLEICGFNMREKLEFDFDSKVSDYDIDFSIDIMSKIYSVLSTVKTNVDDTINGLNFSSITRLLMRTIMNISNPSKNVFKIFTNAIATEPLILEPILTCLLPYVMFSNIDENPEEYKELMINIIEVAAKLYRLPNLVAKMLPSIKNYPNKTMADGETLSFRGDFEKVPENNDCGIDSMLPKEIAVCFSKHILDLASWQVINIFKTFMYHLKVIADELNTVGAEKLNHTYVELLCTLFCTFLSSVRIIEHTTPDLVVNKFVNNMLELRNILQVLGDRLLELNHNQYVMRSYLNVCYAWGELSILLNFYSTASEVGNLKSNNKDYQLCCVSYVHSYLTAEQWCLINERITNFGEKPCKQIMQSLQLQGIKAVFLFENRKEDIDTLFLRNMSQNASLESLLSDRFVIEVLIPKLPQDIVNSLAKEFIKQGLCEENTSIFRCGALENPILLRSIVLTVLIKIAKCNKRKTERTVDIKGLLTSLFEQETEGILSGVQKHYSDLKSYFNEQQSLNENKLKECIDLIRKLPVLSLNDNVRLGIFLFLSALLEYLVTEGADIKLQVQEMVTGMIQFPSELLTALQPKFIIPFMLNNITDYKSAFSYWFENTLRNSSDFLQNFESLVSFLVKKFESDSKVRDCTTCVLKNIPKIKKLKIYVQSKTEINEQRDKIYKTIMDWFSSEQDDTTETLHFYSLCLKHCFSAENDQKEYLKSNLEQFIKAAINDTDYSNNEAVLQLFSMALMHKKELNIVNDKLILKIWKAVQSIRVEDELKKEYSHLIVLIFEHISNENFAIVCEDLCNSVQVSLRNKSGRDFAEIMVTVNGILQCSLNPTKIEVWQRKVEIILADLVNGLFENANEAFIEEVVTFETNIIQANHFMVTAPIIDEILRTVFLLFKTSSSPLPKIFKPSVQTLHLLLKHRMPLITDRLPSFLQQYRVLLNRLCKASDSSLNLPPTVIEELADCAHQLEKLTGAIVTCGRHVQRIAAYLVADILRQYEHVSMYSSVKIHIDNCIYSLMSLFDQHAISFLMRSLSTASTELFKYMHNNYKRYYKFTGKV